MIAIFCFLDTSDAPSDGIYLFDSQEQADQWRLSVLLELKFARIDGDKFILSIDALSNPPKEETYTTLEELLDGFTNSCDTIEFFHEFAVHDRRPVLMGGTRDYEPRGQSGS